MHGGPEIQDVTLSGALRLKAVEEILAEVDRQCWLAVIGFGVQGTEASSLLASAADAWVCTAIGSTIW